jgi:Fe-Mn family superoxide dismutase
MAFTLANLPFAENALEGWTSAETLAFHHGKHHAGYVAKLNAALEGHELSGKTLEEVVATTRGTNSGIFNLAAQHWNHEFFWNCLSGEAQLPEGRTAELLARDFGSVDAFKDEFGKKALSLFGSGWAWLILGTDGKLKIEQYKDAETPFATDNTPLLTLDVWEHAYYIDFRNDRKAFIDGFWGHANWKHVEAQLD